ncbi:hypothetical protein E1285_37540 [Actinomadura sp. 7K507]|nr:hypothetical protein E1285_37540 [Actinomadura sp. 7K507]
MPGPPHTLAPQGDRTASGMPGDLPSGPGTPPEPRHGAPGPFGLPDQAGSGPPASGTPAEPASTTHSGGEAPQHGAAAPAAPGHHPDTSTAAPTGPVERQGGPGAPPDSLHAATGAPDTAAHAGTPSSHPNTDAAAPSEPTTPVASGEQADGPGAPPDTRYTPPGTPDTAMPTGTPGSHPDMSTPAPGGPTAPGTFSEQPGGPGTPPGPRHAPTGASDAPAPAGAAGGPPDAGTAGPATPGMPGMPGGQPSGPGAPPDTPYDPTRAPDIAAPTGIPGSHPDTFGDPATSGGPATSGEQAGGPSAPLDPRHTPTGAPDTAAPTGAAGGYPGMGSAGMGAPQGAGPQGGEAAPGTGMGGGAPAPAADDLGVNPGGETQHEGSAPPGMASSPGPHSLPGIASTGAAGQPGAPAEHGADHGFEAGHRDAAQGGHGAPGVPGDPRGATQEPVAQDGFAAAGPQSGEGGPALRAVDEREAAFEPGNRIDQELHEAAQSGDSDAFLRVLLNANVLVPIPGDAPLEMTPVQREFRWDAALRTGSAVQVFTSLVRLREVLPESRFVYADFRELIGVWPREDWTMLLNPGTRIGASLRGDQVLALSEWALRVGLVQGRQEVPLPPPRREAAPQMPPDDVDDRVLSPSIMQKVVPHVHVAWYLEQGYDRVGGFVHSTGDVAELQTPIQLYETLGLLYEGSSFSPGDEGVYVIRWPAYCPDLYRIPFGGRNEEDLAAWGEAGWVIERPPFLGSGFAPGSAGSIREYKVDSVRLPYGAEMYYLGRDRSERFIAMYDPDRLAWLRPDANAESWNGRTEATQ